MERVVDVIFDGEVLRPVKPLDLERDARYRVFIEEVEPGDELPDGPGILDDILDLAMPFGVSDLAEQHDHYLYGTPKR
jgi:hypothetical protein